MNDLEITHDTKNFIIVSNITKRKYLANLDKKIQIHGFGKLDQKEIYLEKLYSNNYTFSEDPTELVLTFNISNGKKNCYCNLICDEVFPDADINENNGNLTINELKKIILSLRHKVSYLEHKLDHVSNKLENTYNSHY